ncbi:hypothetical protein HXX76_002911 [Chlamydomonas incerta]|uniref:PNPLA domain-containing protein n=1 Tax=Chlamydomonas incerta TaxID=51695 RepID=A0A835TFK9_CHLIN|nr:hypothetical protein HXX76_002911 [Chlamydomonas incerta]|eukprot:KAG2442832.1 hypothetical protein HXX76_002911 [Chlamydomonas incerta]
MWVSRHLPRGHRLWERQREGKRSGGRSALLQLPDQARSPPPLLTLLVVLSCCSVLIAPTSGAGSVFEPKQPARVFVWAGSDQPGVVYPELSPSGDWGIPDLQARPNLGVALSGGGYRAATLAVGWVRALHALGLMPHARYVASNSGGSWFNGVMSYSGFPLAPFLGPYLPPARLNRPALASPSALPPGCWGDTLAAKDIIADAVKGVLKDMFVPGRASFSGWTAAIAEAFFSPYGLDLQNSSITALRTRGPVAARLAAQYPGVPLYAALATADRPFPIILGSVMRVDTPQVFYAFEATPLYVGAPARDSSTDPPIGPGFVEPLGFNSPAPEVPLPAAGGQPPVGLQGAVNVTPARLVPLSTYAGISSSFVAQGVRPSSSAGFALTGTERLDCWNPVNYTGAKLSFADGAGADNLAVTPLLRRRVSSVVVLVAAANSADVSPVDFAVAQYDIAGLFGAVPANATSYSGLENGITGVQPDEFNRALQVFPREGYDQLYAALAGSLAAGQPALHRAAYTVLDNAAQAITGGWTVEVLWLVNMRSRQWESQLPADTQAFLNSSRDDKSSDLRHYPYISTFTANYSPELVTLLSQQASWSLLQAAPELRELLAAAAAPNATAAGNAAVGGGAAMNETASAAGVGAAGARGGGSSSSNISNIISGGGSGNGTEGGAGGAGVFGVAGANGTAQSAAAADALLEQLAADPFAQQVAGALPPRVVAQLESRNASKGLPDAARQPAVSYVMALPQQQGGGSSEDGASAVGSAGGASGGNSSSSSGAIPGPGSSTANSTTIRSNGSSKSSFVKILGPEVQGAQSAVAAAPPPAAVAAAQGAAERAGGRGDTWWRALFVLLAAASAARMGVLDAVAGARSHPATAHLLRPPARLLTTRTGAAAVSDPPQQQRPRLGADDDDDAGGRAGASLTAPLPPASTFALREEEMLIALELQQRGGLSAAAAARGRGARADEAAASGAREDARSSRESPDSSSDSSRQQQLQTAAAAAAAARSGSVAPRPAAPPPPAPSSPPTPASPSFLSAAGSSSGSRELSWTPAAAAPAQFPPVAEAQTALARHLQQHRAQSDARRGHHWRAMAAAATAAAAAAAAAAEGLSPRRHQQPLRSGGSSVTGRSIALPAYAYARGSGDGGGGSDSVGSAGRVASGTAAAADAGRHPAHPPGSSGSTPAPASRAPVLITPGSSSDSPVNNQAAGPDAAGPSSPVGGGSHDGGAPAGDTAGEAPPAVKSTRSGGRRPGRPPALSTSLTALTRTASGLLLPRGLLAPHSPQRLQEQAAEAEVEVEVEEDAAVQDCGGERLVIRGHPYQRLLRSDGSPALAAPPAGPSAPAARLPEGTAATDPAAAAASPSTPGASVLSRRSGLRPGIVAAPTSPPAVTPVGGLHSSRSAAAAPPAAGAAPAAAPDQNQRRSSGSASGGGRSGGGAISSTSNSGVVFVPYQRLSSPTPPAVLPPSAVPPPSRGADAAGVPAASPGSIASGGLHDPGPNTSTARTAAGLPADAAASQPSSRAGSPQGPGLGSVMHSLHSSGLADVLLPWPARLLLRLGSLGRKSGSSRSSRSSGNNQASGKARRGAAAGNDSHPGTVDVNVDSTGNTGNTSGSGSSPPQPPALISNPDSLSMEDAAAALVESANATWAAATDGLMLGAGRRRASSPPSAQQPHSAASGSDRAHQQQQRVTDDGSSSTEHGSRSSSSSSLDALGADGGRLHSAEQAAVALAELAAAAAAQRALAEALEEWVVDHPVAHVAMQATVVRAQLDLLHMQLALWRPVELLNGRLALLGLAAGLANQAAGSGGPLLAQAAERPLAVPAAFALVVLLTAAHRQVGSRMRWRRRGLLTSATAHRWLGRAAMLAIVAAAVAEGRDPAHRPALQLAREALAGAVAGGPGPGLLERVLGR